jgi:hypothetical protein
MAKTISNVLVGVATLYVKQPNDAIAEWSDTHAYAGTRSARLYKSGTGDEGSTHLQITPPAGETLANWTIGAAASQYTWYYYYEALAANWVQAEFRFEDPTEGSEGWVEITCVPHQGHLGTAGWLQYDLVSDPAVGYGGWGELGIGQNFFDWSLVAHVTTVEGIINALPEVDNASDWELTRVRFELWESAPARSAWIDSVVLNGIPYTIEPGGTAPAMSFSSPFTEVGYTEDGVTMEYAAEATDIMVHEETFPIDSAITKESITVTCNMAEASLTNMNNAMAGAVLSGNIITLGDGVNKTMNLKIEGTSPAGYLRAIQIPKAVASGTVGMSYKKGEKTIVPISFKALKEQDKPVCTIVDNAA